MSGSAPANFSGSLHKFHPAAAAANKGGQDDGIVSDESISECDEGSSPSQVIIFCASIFSPYTNDVILHPPTGQNDLPVHVARLLGYDRQLRRH